MKLQQTQLREWDGMGGRTLKSRQKYLNVSPPPLQTLDKRISLASTENHSPRQTKAQVSADAERPFMFTIIFSDMIMKLYLFI